MDTFTEDKVCKTKFLQKFYRVASHDIKAAYDEYSECGFDGSLDSLRICANTFKLLEYVCKSNSPQFDS